VGIDRVRRTRNEQGRSSRRLIPAARVAPGIGPSEQPRQQAIGQLALRRLERRDGIVDHGARHEDVPLRSDSHVGAPAIDGHVEVVGTRPPRTATTDHHGTELAVVRTAICSHDRIDDTLRVLPRLQRHDEAIARRTGEIGLRGGRTHPGNEHGHHRDLRADTARHRHPHVTGFLVDSHDRPRGLSVPGPEHHHRSDRSHEHDRNALHRPIVAGWAAHRFQDVVNVAVIEA